MGVLVIPPTEEEILSMLEDKMEFDSRINRRQMSILYKIKRNKYQNKFRRGHPISKDAVCSQCGLKGQKLEHSHITPILDILKEIDSLELDCCIFKFSTEEELWEYIFREENIQLLCWRCHRERDSLLSSRQQRLEEERKYLKRFRNKSGAVSGP